MTSEARKRYKMNGLPKLPPSNQVNAVSIHEAGHAVVRLALRRGVECVSIRADGGTGGYTGLASRPGRVLAFKERPDGSFVIRSESDEQLRQRRWASDLIVVLLAGHEAEAQIVPDLVIPDGDSLDREHIRTLLPKAAGELESAETVLARLQHQCQRLVRQHRITIAEMAGYLVANETLSGKEARSIFDLHRPSRRTARWGHRSESPE